MSYTMLVAVDGSPRAPGVVKVAGDFARSLRARIFLFRAVVVPPDYSPAGGTLPTESLELEEEARSDLHALLQAVADVPCDLRTETTAQPWRSILGAADKVDADLIVLGSHGYFGWDRLLGTTAGKVANHSRRNVLVVHDTGEHSTP